ncbi:MAG: succinylglutamate desuccinylase/aspartoacylase family protein [Deltaproteobacteria bacterium]|nr:succinylglutamate desuccinylase/aspartoacylase family protein [Deltaproteobacteria bacterium]
MYIEEVKPGVMRISASADWPRPHVAVCGSIHGNEPCGALAVQRIAGDFESRALAPTKGTVFLIHANPAATSLGLRHTPEGDDLNRLWNFAFVDELRPEAWGYEHHRALELKEPLRDLDVLLDLHSAKTATPAFGISNGEADIDEVAKHIGISYLVQSWYGLADKVIIGFLKVAGTPAISVECGAHGDPEIANRAYHIALRFLRATGAIGDGPVTGGDDLRTVHVVERITKPSEEFRFGAPWSGFQQLEPGTLVGRDRVTEIRVSRRCYAVLPNEEVEVCDDVIYLAVDT